MLTKFLAQREFSTLSFDVGFFLIPPLINIYWEHFSSQTVDRFSLFLHDQLLLKLRNGRLNLNQMRKRDGESGLPL